MSIFANDLGYDFSFLSHQGAYMSSTTFNCIQQYFQPIELPPYSAYHLIGMHNPQLMAKCRVEPILASFLKASENCRRNLIIDLSLPYHDDRCSNRTFQGRYIICNGELLGVRLNTSVRKIGSAYSPWPRHRAKHVTLKIMGKESSFIVGEISLIGLLFESQIDTSAQEYLNEGFDIIALIYESIAISDSTITKKNDLSRQVILLQSEIGFYTNLVTNQAIESMLCQTQMPLIRQKNKIYIEYYDLNKVFISKNRHYVSQNQTNFITPIEINLALTQKKIKIENPQLQSSYKFQLQAYSLQKPNKKNENYHAQIFFRRLFLFSFRSSYQKLVIMLEDSPYTLCFLYLLESIIKQQKTCKENITLSQKFKFIDLPTSSNNLFHKFKFLNMEKTWESIYENQINTGHLVRTLDHISTLQRKQNYFILITADRQVKVVVEMLNNREIVRLQKGKSDEEVKCDDSSLQCLSKINNTLKTWITTNFFSDQELRQLYFSQQFITFFADPLQHSRIWKKHCNKSQIAPSLTDISISKIELSSIKYPQKIEDNLVKNNHLQLQFQTHYSKIVKNNIQISKKQLFSHFLFRRATSIDFHKDQENQSNPLIELLITNEQNIKRNFNFLTRRALTTYQKLSQRVKLNLIATERAQSMKIKCHSCEGQFSYEVMYTCQFIECKESFCYQCLIKFKCFQERRLLKETDVYPKNIKLCPICKGKCKNCTKCEVKRILLTKQSKKCVNSLYSQCHYCKQSQNLYSYQCSNPECKRYFCFNCIEQCYRVRTQQYQLFNWKCFVCQNRCYCNHCESQKSKILALKDLSLETIIRQKTSQSNIQRNNCLKKSIQIKDSDCELIQEIDKSNLRSTISITPKNYQENQSNSTIYNEQTLYKSPSKSKRSKSKTDKLTPLASQKVTQEQVSSTRKRRHNSHKKVQIQHQSPPPKKKIKTNSKRSPLK